MRLYNVILFISLLLLMLMLLLMLLMLMLRCEQSQVRRLELNEFSSYVGIFQSNQVHGKPHAARRTPHSNFATHYVASGALFRNSGARR